MSDKLEQAITLIKAGEKQKAGQILARLIKADPQNERAWLWMSQVVNSKKDKLYCLRQVLAINPTNKTALKALARLKQESGLPEPPPSTKAPARRASPRMSRAQRSRFVKTTIGSIFGLLLVLLCGFFAVRYLQFHNDVAPLAEVCSGKWNDKAAPYSPTKGTHLAIGAEEKNDVWTVSMWHIPWQAQAGSLAETELVLCMSEVEKIFIESCPYSDTGRGRATNWINRYYNKQQAKIIAAKTGQVVSVQTFKSKNSGRGCGNTERFGSSERVISIDGTPISSSEVSDWVESKIIVQ